MLDINSLETSGIHFLVLPLDILEETERVDMARARLSHRDWLKIWGRLSSVTGDGGPLRILLPRNPERTNPYAWQPRSPWKTPNWLLRGAWRTCRDWNVWHAPQRP